MWASLWAVAPALGLPGSYRTIVRLIHRAHLPSFAAPRVIGLDEWAWRRGRCFGTIVCDLERHQVIDLLPVRSAPAIAQWLQAHPSAEIVCRDRSRLYAEGIRYGAPQAAQGVDRFHLVQNLGEALERFFLRYRRDLTTLGASLDHASESTPTLAMLSQARHTRRALLYHQIQQLYAQHLGIAAMARRLQVSRPNGNGRGTAADPSSRPSPRLCDGGGTLAVATPNSSGGSSWRKATNRRGGR
jgi:transposase